MKDLVNKIAKNLHFFILLYGAWLVFEKYGEHQTRVDEIETRFPEVAQNIMKMEKKVLEIQEFKKRREESEFRVQEVEKNILEAQRRLPETINDNEILTYFNQEMSLLNIKDPTIVPGGETPSTFYISKEYSLRAKGTFLQFLVLLERIGTASRIYNVRSLRLVTSGEVQRGRFQMISAESIIEAFRYNPDFKVNRVEVGDEAPPVTP